MSKLSNEYVGKLAVARIDVRDNPRKVREFSVKKTPTSIYFKGTGPVRRLEGYVDYDKLQKLTEEVLAESTPQG